MKKLMLPMVVLAAVLGGCGDDEEAAPGPQTPPNVTVYLHDAPAGVQSVFATLQAIQVHVDAPTAPDAAPVEETSAVDTSDKWKSIPVGEELNLMAAQGPDQAVSMGRLPLPTGKITQVRLMFDKGQSMRVTRTDGSTCAIDLSGLPDTGVKINRAFKTISANPNDNLEVWVDIDLDQSLKARGDCYDLRPVLRISRARNNGAELPLQ